MHTDSLCTGPMPSGSVAPLCFHIISSHHVSSSRPWPRRYRPPRRVARPGLSVERPPIRPVFRAHTRSQPRSSGAPSRSGVGTSIPDRPAVETLCFEFLVGRSQTTAGADDRWSLRQRLAAATSEVAHTGRRESRIRPSRPRRSLWHLPGEGTRARARESLRQTFTV